MSSKKPNNKTNSTNEWSQQICLEETNSQIELVKIKGNEKKLVLKNKSSYYKLIDQQNQWALENEEVTEEQYQKDVNCLVNGGYNIEETTTLNKENISYKTVINATGKKNKKSEQKKPRNFDEDDKQVQNEPRQKEETKTEVPKKEIRNEYPSQDAGIASVKNETCQNVMENFSAKDQEICEDPKNETAAKQFPALNPDTNTKVDILPKKEKVLEVKAKQEHKNDLKKQPQVNEKPQVNESCVENDDQTQNQKKKNKRRKKNKNKDTIAETTEPTTQNDPQDDETHEQQTLDQGQECLLINDSHGNLISLNLCTQTISSPINRPDENPSLENTAYLTKVSPDNNSLFVCFKDGSFKQYSISTRKLLTNWGKILQNKIIDFAFHSNNKEIFMIDNQCILKRIIISNDDKYYTNYPIPIYKLDADEGLREDDNNQQIQYSNCENFLFISKSDTAWFNQRNKDNKYGYNHKQFCIESEKVVCEWDNILKKSSMTKWGKSCEEEFKACLADSGQMFSDQMKDEKLQWVYKDHLATKTYNLVYGDYMYASLYDGSIMRFEISTKKASNFFMFLHECSIHNMAITSDSKYVFSMDSTGGLRQTSFESGLIINKFEQMKKFEVVQCKKTLMKISPGDKYLFVAMQDGLILQIDIQKSEILKEYTELCDFYKYDRVFYTINITPNCEYFLIQHTDTNLTQFDMKSQKMVKDYDDDIFEFGFVNKKKNENYKALKANRDRRKELAQQILKNHKELEDCETNHAENLKKELDFFNSQKAELQEQRKRAGPQEKCKLSIVDIKMDYNEKTVKLTKQYTLDKEILGSDGKSLKGEFIKVKAKFAVDKWENEWFKSEEVLEKEKAEAKYDADLGIKHITTVQNFCFF